MDKHVAVLQKCGFGESTRRACRSQKEYTLRLEDLPAQTGLSMSSFKRAFAETFNMTPWSYITTIRLNAARKLLEETNKLLSEIALDTGFFDQSHFSRTFKRERGITPGEYRRRHQPPVQLARPGASASIQMS